MGSDTAVTPAAYNCSLSRCCRINALIGAWNCSSRSTSAERIFALIVGRVMITPLISSRETFCHSSGSCASPKDDAASGGKVFFDFCRIGVEAERSFSSRGQGVVCGCAGAPHADDQVMGTAKGGRIGVRVIGVCRSKLNRGRVRDGPTIRWPIGRAGR
jgi:hypothetical protein